MKRTITKIAEKLHIKDNSGSTMVEVLAGFTILVAVLTECSVHLLGAAGNMIMKAKDMQTARQTVNSELYKEDAFAQVDGAMVTLTLDTEATGSENYSGTEDVSIALTAIVNRYYSTEAELTIIRIDPAESE